MRVLPANARRHFRRGPFEIHRVYPGLAFSDSPFSGDSRDTGIAGLGCFDHAHLEQGLIVPMHEHRNDEIVSYLRSGQMLHEDSHGAGATLTPTHLMGMNAGSGFWHEESVPVGQVEMLQIFIRPSEAELPPELQFADLDESERIGGWRLVAGPREDLPPLRVRQQVRLLDTQLPVGGSLSVELDEPFDTAFLYVFAGAIQIDGRALRVGDAAVWTADELLPAILSDASPADLVLFQIDSSSAYSRSGTISG